MEEIWKDIKGYEGLYQVSNMGRVKSLERIDNSNHPVKEKILTQKIEKGGYLRVHLRTPQSNKNILVHRLVALSFIPNPENKPEVDHINTIRSDNRVENLRWVTTKENCNNPITIKNMQIANTGENNPMYGKIGKDHHKSKPVLQFTLDGDFIKIWESTNIASKHIGVKSSVASCCREECKSAGGFKWGYLKDYEKIPFKVFDLEIYRKRVV